MHDVHGGLVRGQQLLEHLGERRHQEVVDERDGAGGRADHGDGPAGALGERLGEPGHIAERGGHQDELCVGQFEQRDLPRPAAVGVSEVVELVHDDLTDVGVAALAQGVVGEDLRGATDDRGIGVDRGVAGQHADVVGPERGRQVEELLRHQGLDGCGVVAAAPIGQGGEVGGDRDQALAGPGGRVDDDVGPGDDLQERFLLVRVHREPAGLDPAEERVHDRIGIGWRRDELAQVGHLGSVGGRTVLVRRAGAGWFGASPTYASFVHVGHTIARAIITGTWSH